LIFEVPDGEVAKTMPVVKRVMEDAPHPAISLHVPLQVDARAAKNWDEAIESAACPGRSASRSGALQTRDPSFLESWTPDQRRTTPP